VTTVRDEVIDARESTEVRDYYKQSASDVSSPNLYVCQDCLIPRVQDIADLDISDVKWILIIEKEVLFWQSISTSHLFRLIITAILTHSMVT
jgi:meiotic recombination protein SPO11